MSASTAQAQAQQASANATMPQPSQVDVASAVLQQWTKDTQDQVGFRKGASVSPGKAEVTLEVSSFMQVPAILKALEQGESLRLKFPEPAPGTPDADKIRAEQAQIKNFIRANASNKFSDIQEHLAECIKDCVEFKKTSQGKFSAEDWITAHKLDPKANTLTLNVTSIYRGDAAVAGGKVELTALSVKLEQHIANKKAPQAILTVEPSNANELADAISEYLQNRQGKAKGLANVTVWVGKSADPFTGTGASQKDCNEVLAMPLAEFLKRYGKGKKAPQEPAETSKPENKKEETATTTETKEPVASIPFAPSTEPYKRTFYAA